MATISITQDTDSGGVLAIDSWSEVDGNGFRIESSANFTGSTWRYDYRISSNTLDGQDFLGLANGPELFILEAAAAATPSDFIEPSFSANSSELPLIELVDGEQLNTLFGAPILWPNQALVFLFEQETPGIFTLAFESFLAPSPGNFIACTPFGIDAPICDAGFAVNSGIVSELGDDASFIITPGGEVAIPEPGTYIMLGSMLMLVGYLRRRRIAHCSNYDN